MRRVFANNPVHRKPTPCKDQFSENAAHFFGKGSTHTLGAFYESFEPDVARSLVKRLEIIPTPKHGSWLNVAENDLSSLTVQCVRHRRFGTIEELRRAVEAWAAACNEKLKGIQWHFNVEKARAKLKSLCPIIK